MKKNKFVVFEGLSGSGKSTLSRLLADRIQGQHITTPVKPLSIVRDSVDASFGPMSRFVFYYSSVVRVAEEIPALLIKCPVICDRYIMTTTCFHSALGVDQTLIATCEALVPILPDITFLVTCEDKKRRDRLLKRGMSQNDRSEALGNVEERFLCEYRKRDVIEIDNSADDPSKALSKILSIVCA